MRRREEEDNNTSISHRELREVSQPRNTTEGGGFKLEYVSLAITRIVEPILKALSDIKDAQITEQVEEIVNSIINLILDLNSSDYDISNLPSIVAANLDDGSFLIEWLFLNYRVGFVIEKDPKESIWYLISKSATSGYNQSGNLADTDKKELLKSLVSYVAANS